MSGKPSYEDALDSKYGEPITVPLVAATKETLRGYGRIVTDFYKEELEITPWPVSGWRKLCPGTGTLGGILEGHYEYKWDGDICKARNTKRDNYHVSGRLPADVKYDNRTHVLVREANYHPDSGQVFFPRDRDSFVVLLALPGDDIKPENFVAFYFDGSFGVQIHANIWHTHIYPTSNRTIFLGKQGAVLACVGVDTVQEWGKYLSVPLTMP